MLSAEGEAQPFPWLLFTRPCSDATRAGRAAYIELLARADPASTTAALAAAAAGHLVVGQHTIPVVQMNNAQPIDTVEMVVLNPPLELGFEGFTSALMAAAGYDDITVAAEFKGGSRGAGGAIENTKQFTSVVAWVIAPEDDPMLLRLPDTFKDLVTGTTCRVQVRTRLPYGLQQFRARKELAAARRTPAQQPAAAVAPQQPAAAAAQPMDVEVPPLAADLAIPPAASASAAHPQQQQGPAPPMGHTAAGTSQVTPSVQQQQHSQQRQQQEQQQQQQQQQQGPTNSRAAPAKGGRRRGKPGLPQQQQQQQANPVQQWIAASPVWCGLAEQAQHILETVQHPWTAQEQQELATAYLAAFGQSGAADPAAERAWLLQHYNAQPDSEEYGGSDPDDDNSQRRYPVRRNRGLPANPWYASSPRDEAMTDASTQPTGAGRRQGRRR